MEIGMHTVGRQYTDRSISVYPSSEPVEVPNSSRPEEQKVAGSEVERQIEAMNKWLQATGSHLQFKLHEELNEYYVQIIDNATNEVIREIPPKKIMDMVAKMYEMIGILVDEKR